ncbi:hypothetical protein O0L34_g11822 [Tuta absoluta]|nr:hypothetical protein O0L34_g11822 [Tuta absoluta]
MNNDDINEYVPSLLNPRAIKKQHGDLTLTQNSIVSRCSLSLKRKNGLVNAKKALHKTFPPPGKENVEIRSSLNCSLNNKNTAKNNNGVENSLIFSPIPSLQPVIASGKNNSQKALNSQNNNKVATRQKTVEELSFGLSTLDDLNATEKRNTNSSPFSFTELLAPINNKDIEVDNNEGTLIALSSHTDLDDTSNNKLSDDAIVLDKDETLSTIVYEGYEVAEKQVTSISFCFIDCDTVQVSTNKSNIKKVAVTRKDNAMNVDCQIEESSRATTVQSNDDVIVLSSEDESPPKKRNATVNLEIKKKTSTETPQENSKVLILNTNAIEKLSHVIVQPPNYKLVKRKISDTSKFQNKVFRKPDIVNNGKLVRGLKQKRIDSFLLRGGNVDSVSDVVAVDNVAMSKNLGAEGVKYDRSSHKASVTRREVSLSPRPRTHNVASPRVSVKGAIPVSDRNAQKLRLERAGSNSPAKFTDSIHLNLPSKATSEKRAPGPKKIPYHKFVSGTHFAVDAFSYGEIPQVKYYFLTHFHSDHYSGLKKTFNKTLFCSKITAELCLTRLGVNSKCIHVINLDEAVMVDGIEVLAVDANHCPGALMLVFTLPNGKTLLHTGDFRASPQMESCPVFWNKDIHTVYLDTTYCNPRYDFPTQEQCLEMALYLLRQKKLALEKIGKKFSSVLIVCGTYTIGKEKFFMGMARRVGCSVWACPEKDKVLQAVEGRSFCSQPPSACQLHVVPMRDLTHEKLRSYLDSLGSAFSEVVAFKPSGWENGKNSTQEKDSVTIHGIPYSEHSSFSELIRFVKFLQPKQVVPTVDISGGIKAVQKYFPCPLVDKETPANQSKVTDYFSIQHPQHVPAGT